MSARRNAHATQSHAWLSFEMAMVVREINQMAPTPSISGSHRRRQHITCAACPNPAARLLTVAQPIGVESHSTGAPQRVTPRRIFARAGSVLSATTRPGRTRFAVRSLCLVSQARWSAKYSSDSIASGNRAGPEGIFASCHQRPRMRCPERPPGIPGVHAGGPQRTRAAISDVKCRQEGDTATDRDRPALLHHAMMPSQAILPDCADELHCNSGTPNSGGAMSLQTSKNRNQATDYGCPARLAPKKQRLI